MCFLANSIPIPNTVEQELDSVILEWGDMKYHSPVLLAWTVFKFVTQPDISPEALQHTRLLGNRALQAGVFGYMNKMLDSPFFSGDRVRGRGCEWGCFIIPSLSLPSSIPPSLSLPPSLPIPLTLSSPHFTVNQNQMITGL